MKQPIAVELFYDAAWNAVPAYDRSTIVNRHGRPVAEAGEQPSAFPLEVDNRSGLYSPRNPAGALYGKIGRNTPARVRVGSDVRAVGEASGWLPGRSLRPGTDVWVNLDVGGVTTRLGQGEQPLRTSPYRYATLTDTPDAYWPLEEGTLADFGQQAAGFGPFNPMTMRANASTIKPGEGELGPWLAKGVKLEAGTVIPFIEGAISPFTVSVALDFIYAGGVGVWSGLIYGLDGLEIWRVRFDEPAGQVSVRRRTGGEGSAETTLTTVSTLAASDRRCHVCRLFINDNGADVDYIVYIDGVQVINATQAGANPPGAGKVRIQGDNASGAVVNIGHVALWDSFTSGMNAPADAAAGWLGYPGEAAGTRISRLCTEEGISFTSTGGLADTVPLGAQHPDTLLEILREAAAADLGFLYDRLDAVGLHYRTRRSCENQAAALTLNFASKQVAPPFDAAGDDLPIRNDVTVSRRDGSSSRAVLTAGPLSTAAPPAGVGTYDEALTVNVAGDGHMLDDQAGWRLHMGTVNEDRFPRLTVDLDRYPSLAAAVTALRVGDRIAVNGLPADLSVDPLSLIIEGWTETLGNFRRLITLNCAPESPYRVLVYQSGQGSTVHKYDSGGSTLNGAHTSTATSLSVAVATGHPLWIIDDPEDGFDINVGGERMTVTDISGAASPQTFTVTRSVNGVVKAHSSGAEVHLWQPPIWAL